MMNRVLFVERSGELRWLARALGLLLALVIVWIGFLIMTLAYTTEAGSACFEMVEKSSILRFLYETNPLLIRLLKF